MSESLIILKTKSILTFVSLTLLKEMFSKKKLLSKQKITDFFLKLQTLLTKKTKMVTNLLQQQTKFNIPAKYKIFYNFIKIHCVTE